ncbi:Predicted arabinose efflux permease, MFS family [Jatrophihabitans endophyticus]|uniref:Predicted arabinose efflux permease, MFS family n=1 Tax=Jatrophihabitans endophyticus TaxID=1206085 RepID=A0A1M5D9D0_9ACTN|nr:MFS transporter [Jatrophihabitans endophyticus]SHF63527.1 Predicted arabinose efflux permease, MFS family [Jatrophihabitans endophyticus]
MRTVEPVRRRGGLWHHLDFRRLWIGETVSQFGTQISQVALPLVAILALHASTFEVGLLTAFESIAFLVVGLPAGAWVDRMRYRWVLVVNDVVRAAGLASVPAAQAMGALTIGQLYVVALVVGVGTVFFDVAYQSYLPQLVDRRGIVEGNAKLQASESVSQIAGPSAGGLLVQALTAPYAVLVDALSFLWSASWVAAIRARPPKPARRPDRHLGREIREGLAFVLHDRNLRAIAMCTGTANLFNTMGFAVFFVLLARDLSLSAGAIGLIMSTAAVGGLLGSFVATRVARRFGQGPTIWGSIAVSMPTGFVAPFVHRDWSLGLLAVAFVVFWGTSVVYNITQVSFRQGLCPPQLLGRMNATMRFLVWGTMPLGGVIGGALGSAVGVRGTLLVAAIGGCLPVLPVFFSPLRWQRELPTYVSDDETRSSPVESAS